MASIKDIARELNMSVSTVSLALNNKPRVSKETREKVLAKAKELKYVKNGIAADLKRQKTNLILLIVNDASRSFFSQIINQLQKATAAFDYDFLICSTYGNHLSTAKRFIQEHRADGIIVYTKTIPDEWIIENARDDFPIVVLGRKLEADNVYSYAFEDASQLLSTTEYLIQTGHQKIALVKGSQASLGTSRTASSYKATLEAYGIPYDESLVFEAGGSSYRHGYEITKQLLPQIRQLDAIQYSTDDIAIGGILCLRDHHISVPDDISIVGRNNIPESSFIYPALTTSGNVDDDYLFYESLVHHLIMVIEKNEENENVTQQLKKYLDHYHSNTQLIVRDSVKIKNK